MQDIQLIYPQDVLPLTSLTESVGEDGERLVELVGSDFRSVGEVVLNEIRAQSVVILSRNKLLAVVPEVIGEAPIESVSVYSSQLSFSSRSRIQFKLGDVTTSVSGMLRLMQRFLFLLLTTPGRDIFTPALGGGIMKSLGKNFGGKEGSVLVSDFVLAVDRVVQQMIALQAQERAPANEQLLSALVTTANFSKDELALITSIELTNQAREIGTANVRV